MAPGEMFDADSDDTEEELMAATYHALCEHGYADLTIQTIGEEFSKSTSLLYHHYDGKDELLVAFLEYVLERFEGAVPSEEIEDPWTELVGLLDHVLAPTLPVERREFTSAMVELRAQAAHDPAYREAFTRHDRFFHERLTSIVRDGVERGAFRQVDPDAVASLVQATFNGAMVQRATTDPDDSGLTVEGVRAELEAALVARLRPTDGTPPEADE